MEEQYNEHKLIFKIAQSVEKIESALFNSPLNNNKGFIAILEDVDSRVSKVENHIEQERILKDMTEKKGTKRIETIVAAAIIFGAFQTVIAGISLYFYIHK